MTANTVAQVRRRFVRTLVVRTLFAAAAILSFKSAAAAQTVYGSTRPPVLEDIPNRQVRAGHALVFDAVAHDANHDPLVYSLPTLLDPSGSPQPLSALGASIQNMLDGSGRQVGRITIVPDDGTANGVWRLTVQVTDGVTSGDISIPPASWTTGSDEQVVSIAVGLANQSPLFSSFLTDQVFLAAGQPLFLFIRRE